MQTCKQTSMGSCIGIKLKKAKLIISDGPQNNQGLVDTWLTRKGGSFHRKGYSKGPPESLTSLCLALNRPQPEDPESQKSGSNVESPCGHQRQWKRCLSFGDTTNWWCIFWMSQVSNTYLPCGAAVKPNTKFALNYTTMRGIPSSSIRWRFIWQDNFGKSII